MTNEKTKLILKFLDEGLFTKEEAIEKIRFITNDETIIMEPVKVEKKYKEKIKEKRKEKRNHKKFSKGEIRFIKKEKKRGTPQSEIARMLGRNQSSIYSLIITMEKEENKNGK